MEAAQPCTEHRQIHQGSGRSRKSTMKYAGYRVEPPYWGPHLKLFQDQQCTAQSLWAVLS